MSLLLGPFVSFFKWTTLCSGNVYADDIFGTKDYNLINEFDFFAVVSLNTTHCRRKMLQVCSVRHTEDHLPALCAFCLRAWHKLLVCGTSPFPTMLILGGLLWQLWELKVQLKQSDSTHEETNFSAARKPCSTAFLAFVWLSSEQELSLLHQRAARLILRPGPPSLPLCDWALTPLKPVALPLEAGCPYCLLSALLLLLRHCPLWDLESDSGVPPLLSASTWDIRSLSPGLASL